MAELVDSYVKFLAHFDGVDAATADIDYSGNNHPLTFGADAELDTAQSRFGLSSLLLDGVGDYVSAPDHDDWDFGTGEFTIDLWYRGNSWAAGNPGLISHGGPGTTVDVDGWSLIFSMPITIFFRLQSGAGRPVNMSRTIAAPNVDQWYHVAVTRDSADDIRILIDGVQQGAVNNYGGDFSLGNSQLRVGGNHHATQNFNGWIDEVRISKGIARWAANFTPVPYAYQKIARQINS